MYCICFAKGLSHFLFLLLLLNQAWGSFMLQSKVTSLGAASKVAAAVCQRSRVNRCLAYPGVLCYCVYIVS